MGKIKNTHIVSLKIFQKALGCSSCRCFRHDDSEIKCLICHISVFELLCHISGLRNLENTAIKGGLDLVVSAINSSRNSICLAGCIINPKVDCGISVVAPYQHIVVRCTLYARTHKCVVDVRLLLGTKGQAFVHRWQNNFSPLLLCLFPITARGIGVGVIIGVIVAVIVAIVVIVVNRITVVGVPGGILIGCITSNQTGEQTSNR